MTDNRTTELLREFTENAIYCNQFGSLYADEERIAEYAERIEQAIAATLGVDVKDCENLLWEFIGALDVADATDADKKPIVSDYARRIAATLGNGTYEMECGGQFRWDEVEPPSHCPNCGAKVVDA